MEQPQKSVFETILIQFQTLSYDDFRNWFKDNFDELNQQENQNAEQFFTEQELLFGLHEVFQDGRKVTSIEETESVSMTFTTLKYGQRIRIYGLQ
jgi:hypothetical protein